MAAVDIILYQFEKAENSTRIPAAATPSETMHGRPREPFSVTAPVFGVQDANVSIIKYDFAYIPDFERYYHINNWSFAGGLWYATLSVDVLASYREQIRSSNQYVTRSADEFDGSITDGYYPTKKGVIYSQVPNSNAAYNWSADITSGTYVVGIVNNDDAAIGVVSYYVFTNTQFRSLCDLLMTDPAYLEIDAEEISTGLQRALVNPFQYIESVTWFPFEVAHGGLISSVKYGWWEFDTSCYRLGDLPYSRTDVVFTLPQHPQSASRGTYLNSSPYTSYSAIIPGFGSIDIPADMVSGAKRVEIQIGTDSITGRANAYVYVDGLGFPIITASGQIGVSIQISAQSSDLGWEALVGKAAGTLARQDWGEYSLIGDAFSAASIIFGSISAQSLESKGGNGSVTQFSFPPYLQATFATVIPDDNTHRGRPLCQRKTLSTLSGYTMVADPHITFGLESEQTQIKSYMRGGFYLE